MNDLQFEKTPYLLQHKENPVNWMTWGKKAFELAKQENKPIFLSIGYSTCHWCHVMAHESFESDVVADMLNRHFISIKVDREERPDVDSVYMAACIAANGSGGWPLTVLMTPEQKPFWVGTYLKRNELLNLLSIAVNLWENEPEKLLQQGSAMEEHLKSAKEAAPGTVRRALPESAAKSLIRRCDKKWGGFGFSNKFPMAHNLIFLMRYSQITGDDEGMRLAELTLERMSRGGIFDHIGGGFSRYSTDVKWLAPHFEKMLYDNALLLLAYTEAYLYTRREWFRSVAERTAEYVLHELRAPEGGFYCGQDADSDGQEGKYYIFAYEELQKLLGSDAIWFCSRYGVTPGGNFHGQNILNLIETDDWERIPSWEASVRNTVYDYRRSRTALHRDEKVLTAWNGLMIGALARAGFLLGHSEWIAAAQQAVDFIETNMKNASGHLLARWCNGEAAFDAKLSDCANYAWGLLQLYEACFQPEYLERACVLCDDILDAFFDTDRGGCYPYSKLGEQLLTRKKEADDGALPSGNSMVALVLSRLSRLTGEPRFSDAADMQLRWLAGTAETYPSAYCAAMLAMLEALSPTEELVVCTEKDAIPAKLSAYLKKEHPQGLTVLLKTPKTAQKLATLAPFTAAYPIPEDGILYYRCKNGACSRPTSSL